MYPVFFSTYQDYRTNVAMDQYASELSRNVISLPIKSIVHGNNNLSRVDETKDLTKFVLKLHLANRLSCPNGSICRCKNMITDLT